MGRPTRESAGPPHDWESIYCPSCDLQAPYPPGSQTTPCEGDGVHPWTLMDDPSLMFGGWVIHDSVAWAVWRTPKPTLWGRVKAWLAT